MISKFAHDLTHVQPVKHIWLTNKQKLEQKLGEALGVEMATQKAVEELFKRAYYSKEK